jgi:hypothetical protein
MRSRHIRGPGRRAGHQDGLSPGYCGYSKVHPLGAAGKLFTISLLASAWSPS